MAIKFQGNEVYEAAIEVATKMVDRLRIDELASLRRDNGLFRNFGTFYDVFRPLYTTDRHDVILDELGFLHQRAISQRANNDTTEMTPPVMTRPRLYTELWFARLLIGTISRVAMMRSSDKFINSWVESAIKLTAMAVSAGFNGEGFLFCRKRFREHGEVFLLADEATHKWTKAVPDFDTFFKDVVCSNDAQKNRIWNTKAFGFINVVYVSSHPVHMAKTRLRDVFTMRCLQLSASMVDIDSDGFAKDTTIEEGEYSTFISDTITDLIEGWNLYDVYSPLLPFILMREYVDQHDIEEELFRFRHDILNIEHDGDLQHYN